MRKFSLNWMVPFLVAGCAGNFTPTNEPFQAGARAMKAGDYDVAISDFQEALRLDPEVPFYHDQLASAYLGKGRLLEGWPHARRALYLDPTNRSYAENCLAFSNEVLKQGLVKIGDSSAKVRKNLGPPDKIWKREQPGWQYGVMAVVFDQDHVTSFVMMELLRA